MYINQASTPTQVISRPPATRTDGSNAFAHVSMRDRVSGIIGDTIRRNPDYHQSIKDGLKKLQHDVATDAAIRLFDPPAPDYEQWAARFPRHKGSSWLGAEWFFAEVYAYRLVVQIARFWETMRDPFLPIKEEEMNSAGLWDVLGKALEEEGTLEEQLIQRLAASLWGNRIDMSMEQVAAQGTEAHEDHLLDDDLPEVAQWLIKHPAPVHFIMDNAGTEQALDLDLADLMLRKNIATQVLLHVKMQPTLVSDVIPADIHRLIELMDARGGDVRSLAQRLTQHLESGRLRVVPDFFWTGPDMMFELPPYLFRSMEGASLIISKGDLNYRRISNDAVWPAGVSLEQALGTFPSPLLALRTLKSDTVLRLSAEQMKQMDADDPEWRINGRYGIAQFERFGQTEVSASPGSTVKTSG